MRAVSSLGLLLAVVWIQHASGATWTDANGRSFEASLVRVLDGGRVMLALPDGRQFEMEVAGLSQKDQMKLKLLQSQARPANGAGGSQHPSGDPAIPAAGASKPLNFGYAWPMHTRMDGGSQVKVVAEQLAERRFVYESPNYRFVCDVKLNLDVLRQFSVLFETTHKYVRALPLALDGGVLRDRRLEVMLFETSAGYARAGGMPGSLACYVPAHGVVLAPLESLGVKRLGTNSFSMDMQRNNHVLVHELAHQLTPAAYTRPVLRNGWFMEGMAEYVASTPYNWGYFRSDPHGNAVLSYVTGYGEDGTLGRALGRRITMPRLEHLLQMSYREFSANNGNLNYGVSLLLVHYFLHFEGNGDARRFTDYLKRLRDGSDPGAAVAALLPGGGYEQLEKDFASAWRKKGVEITFRP